MSQKIAKEYNWKVKIATFDIGENGFIKPSSLMKLHQETGELHLAEGGLSFTDLIAKGMAFLSVQTKCCINRMPELAEDLNFRTWHRDTKGARFYRCYQVIDKDDNIITDSITSFVLVDFKTHKILRPSEFEDLGFVNQGDRETNSSDPKRLRPPTDMVKSDMKRHVFLSDIDWNGHVNNTIYADIIFDYLVEEIKSKELKEFTISFLNEVKLGEDLIISTKTSKLENGKYESWVTGDFIRENKKQRCFDSVVEFSDKAYNKDV